MYFESDYDYDVDDDDDFFYHMYFDEVSTTPLPDEFYDILESVSGGASAQVVNQPADYLDLLNNRKFNYTSSYGSGSSSSRDTSKLDSKLAKLRASQAKRANQTRANLAALANQVAGRVNETVRARNPKGSRLSRVQGAGIVTPQGSLEGSRATRNHRMSRWRRGVNSHKARQSKNRKKNRKRNGKRKTKVKKTTDPRIVGILDRRVPPRFRQSPFVIISLAKFAVLSTGVTTLASGRGPATSTHSKIDRYGTNR